MSFYDEEHIRRRQDRWKEEEAIEETEEDYEDEPEEIVEPFFQETPKIGRNSPCPCGSGKKYKKCCMKKMY
jgi:uncharacterized protein YecA (UPF0149 family)